MPLVPYSLQLVRDCLSRLKNDPASTGRVLCLSCPDVIVPPDRLVQIVGPAASALGYRPDSKGILNWHKAAGYMPGVVDTAELFALMGWQLTAVDVAAGRGGEILHDLCYPLPGSFEKQFDLVFDCISNQVFDVAAAWRNMAYAVRPGGYVVSVTPVRMTNQGFWSVCPSAYAGFFKSWNDTRLEHRNGVYGDPPTVTLDPTVRVRDVDDAVMNVLSARRPTTDPEPATPMLAKFIRYPDCKLS